MHFETVFLVLFAIASAVAIAAHRLRIPYTVALVGTGLVLGVLRLIEPPHLTRELLYSFILPGLLFEASFHLDLADLWKNRIAIPMLAAPGVVASILLTAGILASLAKALPFMKGFGFPEGLVFGAVIAATDPVAVVALFRTAGCPRRLRVLVEGESLWNDGTSLVLYGLVLGFVSGAHVTAGSLALAFFKVVGAGVLAGVAAGWVGSRIIRSIDDPMIEITLTTIVAYGSFVGAESIGGSGVIATVTAGILCGNYAVRRGMNPATRVAAETFWEYVAFALNSVVFLLVGFELRAGDLLASWQPILVAYLAVTIGRGLVISGVSGLLRRTRESIPWTWTPVLTWAGLRGALSMVLALTLAVNFSHRSLIVTMTFGVVLLTILVQGTTMGWLLKRSGLVPEVAHRGDLEAARGRAVAARAALAEIERMGNDYAAPRDVLRNLREEYEKKIRASEEALDRLRKAAGSDSPDESRGVRRHLLVTEKSSLLEAARGGLIGPEAFEKVSGEIDGDLVALEEPAASDPGVPEPEDES
ncbi:MAG TPA: sodium:proton antiporter [Thermoanaerobaculia bacterium]